MELSDVNKNIDVWCLKGEIWKDIPGYEGIYQASTFGRIRSLDRYFTRSTDLKPYFKEGCIRRQHINNMLYCMVALYDESHNFKFWLVHRLVALTFIPNDDPENKPYINHKIEWETWNNRVENLEWCDAEYNSNYGTGSQRGASKMTSTKQKQVPDVLQFDMFGELIGHFTCCADAARKTGFPPSSISKCCNGEFQHCRGYIFRYDYEGFWINEDKPIVLKIRDKVDCYTKEGEFVTTYNSPTEAANALGASTCAHISSCCNGNREWAYGYVWRRHGEAFDKYPPVGTKKKKLCRRVLQMTLDGTPVMEHDSVMEAAKHVGVKYGVLISKCIVGKRDSAYGYRWESIGEFYKDKYR